MNLKCWVLTAFLVGAISATIPAYAISIFDHNLIINGDAESDIGSSTGNTIGSVTGFTTVGNFTVTKYGASGGFPLATDPGPVNRGLNFFSGGPSNAASSASQVIDVSSGASTIDLGNSIFELTGFLGGFSDQGDNAVLTASFLNGTNNLLGNSSIGPVTNGDRSNTTGLLLKDSIGSVPVGTRSINLSLAFTRTSGQYNDGYADNLSLQLHSAPTAVPEPSSFALLGLGIIALVISHRYRKQQTA